MKFITGFVVGVSFILLIWEIKTMLDTQTVKMSNITSVVSNTIAIVVGLVLAVIL